MYRASGGGVVNRDGRVGLVYDSVIGLFSVIGVLSVMGILFFDSGEQRTLRRENSEIREMKNSGKKSTGKKHNKTTSSLRVYLLSSTRSIDERAFISCRWFRSSKICIGHPRTSRKKTNNLYTRSTRYFRNNRFFMIFFFLLKRKKRRLFGRTGVFDIHGYRIKRPVADVLMTRC